MAQMKEQNQTPEKELSEMEIANLSDAEFKTLVIRMTQRTHWVQKTLKGRNKGYTKWNKEESTGDQQWTEGSQGSNQQFGT